MQFQLLQLVGFPLESLCVPNPGVWLQLQVASRAVTLIILSFILRNQAQIAPDASERDVSVQRKARLPGLWGLFPLRLAVVGKFFSGTLDQQSASAPWLDPALAAIVKYSKWNLKDVLFRDNRWPLQPPVLIGGKATGAQWPRETASTSEFQELTQWGVVLIISQHTANLCNPLGH